MEEPLPHYPLLADALSRYFCNPELKRWLLAAEVSASIEFNTSLFPFAFQHLTSKDPSSPIQSYQLQNVFIPVRIEQEQAWCVNYGTLPPHVGGLLGKGEKLMIRKGVLGFGERHHLNEILEVAHYTKGTVSVFWVYSDEYGLQKMFIWVIKPEKKKRWRVVVDGEEEEEEEEVDDDDNGGNENKQSLQELQNDEDDLHGQAWIERAQKNITLYHMQEVEPCKFCDARRDDHECVCSPSVRKRWLMRCASKNQYLGSLTNFIEYFRCRNKRVFREYKYDSNIAQWVLLRRILPNYRLIEKINAWNYVSKKFLYETKPFRLDLKHDEFNPFLLEPGKVLENDFPEFYIFTVDETTRQARQVACGFPASPESIEFSDDPVFSYSQRGTNVPMVEKLPKSQDITNQLQEIQYGNHDEENKKQKSDIVEILSKNTEHSTALVPNQTCGHYRHGGHRSYTDENTARPYSDVVSKRKWSSLGTDLEMAFNARNRQDMQKEAYTYTLNVQPCAEATQLLNVVREQNKKLPRFNIVNENEDVGQVLRQNQQQHQQQYLKQHPQQRLQQHLQEHHHHHHQQHQQQHHQQQQHQHQHQPPPPPPPPAQQQQQQYYHLNLSHPQEQVHHHHNDDPSLLDMTIGHSRWSNLCSGSGMNAALLNRTNIKLSEASSFYPRSHQNIPQQVSFPRRYDVHSRLHPSSSLYQHQLREKPDIEKAVLPITSRKDNEFQGFLLNHHSTLPLPCTPGFLPFASERDQQTDSAHAERRFKLVNTHPRIENQHQQDPQAIILPNNVNMELKENSKTDFRQYILPTDFKELEDKAILFVCKYCNLRLSSNTNLNKHIRSVHEKVCRYKCAECDAQFYQKYNYNRHMKKIHGKNNF